jgi:ABC-2 type transport system ATP-binding protein
MSEPVAELRGVVKRFRAGGREVLAVDGVSARVGEGRITGLVGPDGAGKTTLMRLIAGLLTPETGEIRVLGLDIPRQAHEVQQRLGYMPQRFGLYEDLSVAENLDLYADLHGLSGSERRARFKRLLEFTGLGPFRGRLAGRLSGGMKQKLGLACTLIGQPRLLLLDEPSVGVDPVSRRELWDIVHALVKEGMSVLWSTAYLDEAQRCHEVILLNEGRVLDVGPPAGFIEPLRGRTFALSTAPSTHGTDKRAVLGKVGENPLVLDAVIKGREVHLLLARTPDTDERRALERTSGSVSGPLEPVEPAFEDAFIALLKEQQAEAETPAPTAAARPQPAAAPSESEFTGTEGPVIEVEGLVRTFGRFRAVDGIDFRVRKGEIFGLLGPNGAGKSTTFRMLCGLLPPTDGTARVLGIDLRRAAAVARGRIGYMAQKFSLYGNMSVVQNLRFFASAYGLAGEARRRIIERELEEFGLRPYAEVNSEDLPLGYKQRLSLACAILHEPGILFLDEPTSGVDPLARREFWSRITGLAATGVTVMVTTHFMEEAEYCDRIGIIYRGRLVASGTPDALKAEHRTPGHPDPTLEDAFVDLIEGYDREHPQ